MKKNQKGFTLVELLAVIVILAVIILIAVNAVLPQMNRARKNSFADEAMNYLKAAETKYVEGSISSTTDTNVTKSTDGSKVTIPVSASLNQKYVSKSDYKGMVVLTIDVDPTSDEAGNVTAKQIWLTDCSNYMLAAQPGSGATKIEGGDVKAYNASTWASYSGSGSGAVGLPAGEVCTSN